MKKINVLLLLLLSLFTTLQAQQKVAGYQDADTNDILRPELFSFDCNIYDLKMCDTGMCSLPIGEYFTTIFNYPISTWKVSANTIDGTWCFINDLAQPYWSDTTVAIKGVLLYGGIDTVPLLNMDEQEYVQILDENFNVLVQARIDTISNANGNPMVDPYNFIEIAFDTTIIVSGRFYVNVTFNHVNTDVFINGEQGYAFEYLGGFKPMEELIDAYEGERGFLFTCDTTEAKYDVPRLRFDIDDTWYKASDLPSSGIVFDGLTGLFLEHLAVVSIYPKIDTTWSAQSSSGLNSIEQKTYITIYPNPAKEEFFVKSSENIKLIEIFDILGKNIKNISVNSIETSVDISSLEKGTYILKVYTETTVETKKITKE